MTKKIINLLFEIGSLNRIRRNSYQMLGTGDISIAGHSFRTAIIGFFLAKSSKADVNKVLKMCLFHDVGESRMGDLNSINKRYIMGLENTAYYDLFANDEDTKEIHDLFLELKKQKSKESILVHDADILEQLLTEKELFDLGNKSLQEWMDYSLKRLKTDEGLKYGKEIIKIHSHSWWKEIMKRPAFKNKKIINLIRISKNL